MKTKSSLLSAVSEVTTYLILGLLGFVKIRTSIDTLGSEMNGYYQFILQVMTYLFLIEASIAVAIVYRLYKPFTKQDRSKISELFLGAKKILRFIGFLMILVAVCLVPIIFTVVKEPLAIRVEVVTAFLLVVIGNCLPYLFRSKAYSALFFADQKKYIHSLLINFTKIVSELVAIAVIMQTKSLVFVGVAFVIFKLVEELAVDYFGQKHYPWLDPRLKPDTSPKRSSIDLVWNQVGYLINNNIDVIILLIAHGPVAASIYATYNYVRRFLLTIATKISDSIVHSLGFVMAKNDKFKVLSVYGEYTLIFYIIAMFFSTTFYFAIRSFVAIWIHDSSYLLPQIVVFLFSLTLFLNIILQPLISINQAAGFFREVKRIIIYSSATNLVLSLALVNVLGMSGLLLASTISMLLDTTLRLRFLLGSTFDGVRTDLIRKYALYTISYLVLASLTTILERLFFESRTTIANFALYTLSFAVISLTITLMLASRDNMFKHVIMRAKRVVLKKG